jgi:hypothetical protein
MPKRVLIMSSLAYLAYMFLMPFVISDRTSLIMAWAFMTIWFVLYLSFKTQARWKGLR